MRAGAVALSLTLAAAPAAADPPSLILPVACTLGQDCYIEDYVDTAPGPGVRDHACGLKSRDGHSGTDIALLSFAKMKAGTAVLAAAPGRVAATRDGLPDRPVTAETRPEIRGRECGNAVRIDHGQGWQTLYCHLRQGSVAVEPGARVAAGAVLGQVGLSGLTNMPHLHLGVLKDGAVVDPFRPDDAEECGPAKGDGLWADAPPYHRAGLFTAGFATAVPDLDAVRSGAARARRAVPSAPLVLYGHVFHARPGDRLHLSAQGPRGRILDRTIPLKAPARSLFRAAGRRSPERGWPPGAYRGYVRLIRAGTVIAARHADITVAR